MVTGPCCVGLWQNRTLQQEWEAEISSPHTQEAKAGQEEG